MLYLIIYPVIYKMPVVNDAWEKNLVWQDDLKMLWKMPLSSVVLRPYNPPLARKMIDCKSSIDEHDRFTLPPPLRFTSAFLITRLLLRVVACCRIRPDFTSNETVRQNQSRNNQSALEKHVSFFYKTLPGNHGTLANPFISPGCLPG